jgi:hypothetical protein
MILLVLALTLLANQSQWLPTAPLAHAQPPAFTSVKITAPNGSNNVTDLQHSLQAVTFGVNVSNSPPINSFGAVIDYNTTVFSVKGVDYTGNVLGGSATPVVFCIDGAKQPTSARDCLDIDGPGRIDLVMYLLGNQSTPSISKGLLFHITFNIIGTGLGQVHIFSAQLVGLTQNGPVNIPIHLPAEDGYYTNMACPAASSTPCRPPLVTITHSPSTPSQTTLVTFNATVVVRNAGAIAVSYTWNWGDKTPPEPPQTNVTQLREHRFIINALQGIGACVAAGNCSVTMTVTDSAHVSWETTIVVPIVHIFVQLSVAEAVADPQFNVVPGTTVHIMAHISNRSTIAERASLNITLQGANSPLNSANFTLAASGGTGSLNATWDTSGKVPRAYGIVVTIGNVISAQKVVTSAHPEGVYITFQNDTSQIQRTTYVLLVLPLVTGSLSLNLLQSVGLGILVVLATAAGLARFLKKPGYESERL